MQPTTKLTSVHYENFFTRIKTLGLLIALACSHLYSFSQGPLRQAKLSEFDKVQEDDYGIPGIKYTQKGKKWGLLDVKICILKIRNLKFNTYKQTVMKIGSLYIILAIIFFTSCKQNHDDASTPTWYTSGGRIGTNDNSTIVAYDDNLVSCATAGDSICLLKMAKSGNLIWKKIITAGHNCTASALAETSNHELLMVGYTYRNTGADILLVKTNPSGDTLWSRTFGSNKDDYGLQIIKTNDNNFMISGITYPDISTAFCDLYLVKLNSNGDTIWTKTYKDPGQEVPSHILQTQNGEYLITGTSQDNDQSKAMFLKLDANGNKLWEKSFNAGFSGSSTLELSNGDLLTCGKHVQNGYTQAWLVKTNSTGNAYWEKEYGEPMLSEETNSIKSNADGTFTITGAAYDVTTMQDDVILFKVDPNGTKIWYKKFGGIATERGINLIKDGGDNLITGQTYSHAQNGTVENVFMTKLDNNGNFK